MLCGTGEDVPAVEEAFFATYMAFVATGNPSSRFAPAWPAVGANTAATLPVMVMSSDKAARAREAPGSYMRCDSGEVAAQPAVGGTVVSATSDRGARSWGRMLRVWRRGYCCTPHRKYHDSRIVALTPPPARTVRESGVHGRTTCERRTLDC